MEHTCRQLFPCAACELEFSQKKAIAAKVENAIAINSHYYLEGDYWIEVDCADYEAEKALPSVIQYGGRTFGMTGWNSDKCLAYYCSGKKVATY